MIERNITSHPQLYRKRFKNTVIAKRRKKSMRGNISIRFLFSISESRDLAFPWTPADNRKVQNEEKTKTESPKKETSKKVGKRS